MRFSRSTRLDSTESDNDGHATFCVYVDRQHGRAADRRAAQGGDVRAGEGPVIAALVDELPAGLAQDVREGEKSGRAHGRRHHALSSRGRTARYKANKGVPCTKGNPRFRSMSVIPIALHKTEPWVTFCAWCSRNSEGRTGTGCSGLRPGRTGMTRSTNERASGRGLWRDRCRRRTARWGQ
jgi:hypothetical protein